MEAYKARPELPWASTQGGVIILKDREVSFQDIIDGQILFRVLNSHGEEENCRAYKYPSDNKYYVATQSNLIWQIEEFTGNSNRITLFGHELDPTQDKLIGIEFAVEANPELPWSPGNNGTIHLAEPLTMADVLANKLQFKYSAEGEYTIEEYDGSPVLKIGSAIAYYTESWEGSTSEIELIWGLGDVQPSMPYLTSVKRHYV